MSTTTVLGIAAGAIVVTAASLGTLDEPSILWNPAGFAIVIGGTMAAAMVAFSPRQFLRLAALFWGFFAGRAVPSRRRSSRYRVSPGV